MRRAAITGIIVLIGIQACADLPLYLGAVARKRVGASAPPTPPPVAGAYPAPDDTEPAGYAAGYAGFSAFSPPVEDVAPTNFTPEIAEWTRDAPPGYAVALTGEALSGDFVIWGTGYTNTQVSAELNSARQCAVVLPSGLPADDVYVLWPTNTYGVGAPILINQAEAWWVGPHKVSEGEIFSVYGRNLELGNGEDTVLYIVGHGLITADSANPYKADFTCPSLTPGSYTVYAHNKRGREYGWSEALTLTVWEGMGWSDTQGDWITVSADITGVSDASGAINSAIDTADGTEWETVYLPPGVYRLNTEIHDNMSKVRLKGAGSGQTTLIEQVGGRGEQMLDFRDSSDCVIEGMTITVDDTGTGLSAMMRLTGSENMHFNDVIFSDINGSVVGNNKNNWIQLNSQGDTLGFYFTDCSFTNASNFLMQYIDKLSFVRCNWIMANSDNATSVQTCKNMAFIDCTASNFDNTDDALMGSGRWFKCQPGDGPAPGNIYIEGFTSTDFSPDTSNNNSGEDVLFEFSDTAFYDYPVSATSNSITFSSVTGLGKNHTIAVAKGPGLGQYARITNISGNTIYLNKSFRVTPQTDSLIYAGGYPMNVVVYESSFDALTSRWPDCGDSGVQTYGGALNLIVDGNTMSDLRNGMYFDTFGRNVLKDSVRALRPNYWTLAQNNVVDDVQNAVRYIMDEHSSDIGRPVSDGISFIGVVVRSNSIANSDAGFLYEWDGDSAQFETAELTVIEGNALSSVTDPILIWDQDSDTYFSSLSEPEPASYFANQVFLNNTTNEVSWTPQ